MLSFALMINMAFMLTVEPMVHCFGSSEALLEFQCEQYTDILSLAYEFFLVMGIILYVVLIFGIGSSISIQISEYRVLCLRAVKQVMLCFGVITLAIFTFGFAITAMTREAEHEQLGELSNIADESPFLLIILASFMLLVYSFFFNLLVSQFCGVYASLAADSEGHARLSRGDVILDTLKAVQMKRWKQFILSLSLDLRTDFDEGDIGLAGGVKVFEPAGANPKTQETSWVERGPQDNDQSQDKMIQKTIQKSLAHYLGKKGDGSDFTLSSSHNSSSNKGD
eukprot:g9947.t1